MIKKQNSHLYGEQVSIRLVSSAMDNRRRFAPAIHGTNATIETRGGLTYFHWCVSSVSVQDTLRELVESIQSIMCDKDRSMPKLWLGIDTDAMPGEFSDGSILLGDSAAGLLRGYYPSRYLGDVAQRGGNELTAVYALSPSLHSLEQGMVGRDKELDRVCSYCQQTNNDQKTGLVMIHGAAGIGKSMLAREICKRMELAGSKIHEDRYYRSGTGGDKLAEVSARGKPLGNRLDAMEKHLTEGSAQRVWWIDDTHWMPESDRELLSQLARETHTSGVVIITSRPEGENMFSHAEPHRVTLDNFSPDETTTLVNEIAGITPDQDAVAEIMRCTAGDPLLASELASSWLLSGHLRHQKGKLRLRDITTSKPDNLELRQIIEGRLLSLDKTTSRALTSLSMLRGPIRENALEDYFNQCGITGFSGSHQLHYYFYRRSIDHHTILECRHELVREALLSLNESPSSIVRQAAVDYENRQNNWQEVYYHCGQLGEKKQTLLRESLVRAFHQTWQDGQLEQCLSLGQDFVKHSLNESRESQFLYRMGLITYRLGMMRESEVWMKKASGLHGPLVWMGIAGHGIKLMRRSRFYHSKKENADQVAKAYHLCADVHWNYKEFNASAACLIKGWAASGIAPWPSAPRSEAGAGLAVILSATPLKKIRDKVILNTLTEAQACDHIKNEMRVRMLLSIALLGTERWAEAIDMATPAYEWSGTHGDTKLRMQSGITLCAALTFMDERERSLDLSEKNLNLAQRTADAFLGDFVTCVHGATLAAYASNAKALRLMSENVKEHSNAETEQGALLASLYYQAGDDSNSLRYVTATLRALRKHHPTSYGMTSLLEFLAIPTLGLWGKGILDWKSVIEVEKQLVKQRRSFVTARPLCSAWSAVIQFCSKGDLLKLKTDLDNAIEAAQELRLQGQVVSIATLGTALGVNTAIAVAPKKGDVSRLGLMADDISARSSC